MKRFVMQHLHSYEYDAFAQDMSRREAMLCQQEEGCDPFMVAKRNAFKKVMKVVVKSQEKLWKKAHKVC